MDTFKEELRSIYKFLNSTDYELQILGYELLRNSQFKKFMHGKLWSENNKSFYRFRLYKLHDLSSLGKPYSNSFYYILQNHNYNKLYIAKKVVEYYLNDKLIIKEIK